MTLVRDLLHLPAHVSKGDFVQSLAESLREPERTVSTYAVTPELVGNFRDALRVVTSALSTGRSQPVFLHGSFGSGKSHFMAMLHLLLDGHPAPWRRPELHDLRGQYDALAGKRLLQMHFHMLGAASIEAKVFGRYIEHVRAAHPDAPLPGLFRDQEVFDNARRLRKAMGDGPFLAALNQGKVAVAGFGALGGAEAWTIERFEEATTSVSAEVRARLLTDLTRTLLPAFARQTDRFVDIDEGLAEMSRHAASLGYHGIVLYLDELILWLASQSADLPFVQREVNKLVKLKEAQDEARAIPIVSFIARQRDLSEFMGDGATGSERALIEETLGHHAGRFHTIYLTDSNLRAIIPHRVVVTRSPDDRQRLEDGFEDMWRKAKAALDTLQGGSANRDDFRQVFPFSPALIDVLVVLSDRLQRDRTAIRILVEMLVEHLQDLPLGEVVPVGDVFDLVASADDAVDGPSKAAFQRARDLYLHELLPRVRERNKAADATTCQRLRPGHLLRIGCSGCPVLPCRNENRLVKTLLLAALVPKAKPFDGLTVKRLVHLNHGAVKAPVETMAVNLAATKLRDLAREVHALRISDAADPAVSVSLESIDLKPILARANDQDTRARRRFILRQLLWEQLGITSFDNVVLHPVEYRHTKRTGAIHFGNVRTMRLEELVCPDDVEWQVVIDYPFDEPGYTPHDDEKRVEEVKSQLGGRPAWTLVWLPTFFSRQLDDDLGDLARLDHILDPNHLRDFLSHVPPDEHQRARIDLQSLRDRKRFEVIEALKKAYGLARVLDNDPHVDPNRDVNEHVLALDDQVDARTPRGATLLGGLEDLALQLLSARYPKHPHFQATPSPQRLGRVREILEKLLEASADLSHVDKAEREELQKIAEPLYLCRVYEQQAERLSRVYDAIEARRQQENVDDPTLEQVRRWMDPEDQMGLPEPVANLVAWLWAVKHRRVAMEGRSALSWPSNGKLSGSTLFIRPDLPDEETFGKALERAALLGILQRGKALNAQNVRQLAEQLGKLQGSPQVAASLALPGKLAARLDSYAPGARSHRLETAKAVAALLGALDAPTERGRLAALASADLSQTSPQAVARSFHQAQDVLRALEGPSWTVMDLVRRQGDDDRYRARVQGLTERLASLLVDDELTAPMEAGLKTLVQEAQELLAPPPSSPLPRERGGGEGSAQTSAPPQSGWKPVWEGGRAELPAAEALEALDALRAELAARLAADPSHARVKIAIVLEKQEPSS